MTAHSREVCLLSNVHCYICPCSLEGLPCKYGMEVIAEATARALMICILKIRAKTLLKSTGL